MARDVVFTGRIDRPPAKNEKNDEKLWIEPKVAPGEDSDPENDVEAVDVEVDQQPELQTDQGANETENEDVEEEPEDVAEETKVRNDEENNN